MWRNTELILIAKGRQRDLPLAVRCLFHNLREVQFTAVADEVSRISSRPKRLPFCALFQMLFLWVVIGTHIDKGHIHNHILYNSVSSRTGRKEHFDRNGYYAQIRARSDELCRKYGLSVIEEETGKASSYIEWLRQSRGQPTFRSMLEADLRDALRTPPHSEISMY